MDEKARVQRRTKELAEAALVFPWINISVSQYRVQTSFWMLSDRQGPIRAVRSDGAERRRRLTAKGMLRINWH